MTQVVSRCGLCLGLFFILEMCFRRRVERELAFSCHGDVYFTWCDALSSKIVAIDSVHSSMLHPVDTDLYWEFHETIAFFQREEGEKKTSGPGVFFPFYKDFGDSKGVAEGTQLTEVGASLSGKIGD